jgi:CARDB protein
MKVRRLITGCAVTAAAISLPVVAAAAGTPPRAQLVGFSCTHALDPGSRAIAVTAVMRPLTGTRKMALRFELLQRSPGLPVQAVDVGDLGQWRSPPNPTLGQLPGDVWRREKPVYNLAVPFTYQFRVSFRWTGTHGKVLGTATRDSRTCRQRELRPDLTVKSIAVSPIAGHPKKDLYTAVLANQGLTGAGPFQVLFVPGDSSAPTTANVTYLGAGKTRTMSFIGPLCDATSPPTVIADSASQVDDFNRVNNQLTAMCPATPSP